MPLCHFSPKLFDHFLKRKRREVHKRCCRVAVLCIGHHDEFLRSKRHEFLLRLASTAAFDTVELFVDFIGTVDRHVQLKTTVKNDRQNGTLDEPPETRSDCPISIRATESDHGPRSTNGSIGQFISQAKRSTCDEVGTQTTSQCFSLTSSARRDVTIVVVRSFLCFSRRPTEPFHCWNDRRTRSDSNQMNVLEAQRASRCRSSSSAIRSHLIDLFVHGSDGR